MTNPALASEDTMIMTGIDIVPIIPDDDTDLSVAARDIRCRPDGQAGTLRITTLQGEVRDTYIALGERLGVGVMRVHATGTTASSLEAVL